MSAFVSQTSSFRGPSRGLETANAAKHESDICNARSGPVEVHSSRGRRRSEARSGLGAARPHDAPGSKARASVRHQRARRFDLQAFQRPSNNRLDEALADRVIKILRSTYADFGPDFGYREAQNQEHGIDLAKETVRRLQIAVGLWIPMKLRPPKIQQPRMRRACIGQLVQIDGCEHPW
jgi:hypothetical protein